MLGWEDPLIKDVNAIRDEEHRLLMLKSYIRSANYALPDIIQGLSVCVTFITVGSGMTDLEFSFCVGSTGSQMESLVSQMCSLH